MNDVPIDQAMKTPQELLREQAALKQQAAIHRMTFDNFEGQKGMKRRFDLGPENNWPADLSMLVIPVPEIMAKDRPALRSIFAAQLREYDLSNFTALPFELVSTVPHPNKIIIPDAINYDGKTVVGGSMIYYASRQQLEETDRLQREKQSHYLDRLMNTGNENTSATGVRTAQTQQKVDFRQMFEDDSYLNPLEREMAQEVVHGEVIPGFPQQSSGLTVGQLNQIGNHLQQLKGSNYPAEGVAPKP